jgi:hydroxymethylglutaryl-CoA lyase
MIFLRYLDMNLNFPDKVTLIEVGPRDGFQFEAKIIPTDLKIEIISCLVNAGIKRIQVTSFVHPQVVPQMADAEALLQRLPKNKEVTYSGLALNSMGVERAHSAGLNHIEISISASDAHSRKNSNMTFEQAFENCKMMVRLAKKYNMHIRAGIQCAFGCVFEGEIAQEKILEMTRIFLNWGVDMIAISDTTGMATPVAITDLMEKLIPITVDTPIVFHLHDTRGLNLVNVTAAMACGITHFDTSLAGMGGCPFIPGASGNIATEDTAYLMKSLKIETGIDIKRVSLCSSKLEDFMGRRFPGKMYRIP